MENTAQIKDTPKSTIVVVQREKFSEAQRSLELIFEHTNTDYNLVYMSAGAPESVNRYLAEQAGIHGFDLQVFDDFMPPNTARNIALKTINTKYVVFIDNDVLVEESWLTELEKCADETNAVLVGPVYCVVKKGVKVIHYAGGKCEFRIENGHKHFITNHDHVDVPYADICEKLDRIETGAFEFHCVLARRDFIEEVGGLDENFISVGDHEDLSLQAHQRGEKVISEPGSVVTHVIDGEMNDHDLTYFNRRWSKAWAENSVHAMVQKYTIDPDDPWIKDVLGWVRHYSMEPYSGKTRWVKKLFGKKVAYLYFHYLVWRVGDTLPLKPSFDS